MLLKDFPVYLFSIAIFFPLPINILLMSMSLCYAFIRHGLNKKDICLYLFLIGGLIVSLFHRNYLGFYGMLAVCIVAVNLSIFSELSFQREKVYFIILIGSCICAIVGIFQYIKLIEVKGLSFFPLQVYDDPAYRITSVFFNANYYATVLELVLLLAIHCLIHHRLSVLSMFSLLINLLMLYLTGCRTAWLALGVAVPFMFFITGKYRLFKLMLMSEMAIVITMFFFPQLFPRLKGSNSTLALRWMIWESSLRFILYHPLSFKGPMSYLKWCERYALFRTQHAHHLFVDCFLNFGFLSFLLFPFFKKIWLINKKNHRIKTILPFLLAMLIHSLSDATLFWIQTSALFLLLLL